ncbi:hypothetical protein AHiyo4_06260 [Arthrobacter sp. Hiyo4]|nr:hypothetical protein AHiyo4_06260 [Arthrobacter sp. Hiyo4]
MVAHGPDDLGAHVLAGGINNCPELCVGLRVALVGEVTREDHGLGPGAGSPDLVEQLNELGFAVNCAVKGIRTSQQVGVAQVKKEVAWPGCSASMCFIAASVVGGKRRFPSTLQ